MDAMMALQVGRNGAAETPLDASTAGEDNEVNIQERVDDTGQLGDNAHGPARYPLSFSGNRATRWYRWHGRISGGLIG